MSLRGSWTLGQHVLLCTGVGCKRPQSPSLLLFLLRIPCSLLLSRLCLLDNTGLRSERKNRHVRAAWFPESFSSKKAKDWALRCSVCTQHILRSHKPTRPSHVCICPEHHGGPRYLCRSAVVASSCRGDPRAPASFSPPTVNKDQGSAC